MADSKMQHKVKLDVELPPESEGQKLFRYFWYSL